MLPYRSPSLCLHEEVFEAMKTPSPMKVDPPRYPYLTKQGEILSKRSCEAFSVQQVKAGEMFDRDSIIFGFHREGFSNKRGETMQGYVAGQRIDFVCNEMVFKLACGAHHGHIPTMLKTWGSKDFKECTRSTKDIPNFDKSGWDSISGDVMIAGCIMKLTNGSTYDFCQTLVQLASKCGVLPKDIYFFEVNDNDVWATNHNSIKEFEKDVEKFKEEGRVHELILSFHKDLKPFSGENKMGKCLRQAFIAVFGEDGETANLPIFEQKMRMMEDYTLFHVEPRWECKEDMPSKEELGDAKVSPEAEKVLPEVSSGYVLVEANGQLVEVRDTEMQDQEVADSGVPDNLKRCLSDASNVQEEKRARSGTPLPGKEN